MIRFFLVALGFIFFCVSCSSGAVARRPSYFSISRQTPFEYYQDARPAVFTGKDTLKIKNAGTQDVADDTPSESRTAILVGILAGVLVIGGVVGGIMLAK